jgi:hypothetical protein
MTTIEQNAFESKELLAEIRASLAAELESAASYRARVAEDYPEDKRNAQSAHELWKLADELRSNDVYDDTPALRKLLGLVTTHGIDLSIPLVPSEPESGFNVSQYRFRDAKENDDEFLGRLAEAAAEWWRED